MEFLVNHNEDNLAALGLLRLAFKLKQYESSSEEEIIVKKKKPKKKVVYIEDDEEEEKQPVNILTPDNSNIIPVANVILYEKIRSKLL